MITERPKIRSYEQDANALSIGTGGEIPIFISPTLNETPLAGIGQFTKYSEANKLVSEGGIGTAATNFLLPILKDFFEESLKETADGIGVSHIYVKDLGTSVPGTAAPWITAISDAKIKNDVRVEAYVFQKPADADASAITTLTNNVISIMESVASSLKTEAEKGRPRIAYFTVLGFNDTQLREFTKLTNANKIINSRVYLLEPNDFGKTLARICTTPVPDEPGYYTYRSVKPGHFAERSEEAIDNKDVSGGVPLGLQHCGIVVNCDEKTNSRIYPRINLCVATSYALGDEERPTDSLLHARRNVDQLQREAVDVVFPQLKRRETEGYLSDTQAELDLLVYNKVQSGFMKPETSITVVESDDVNAPEELEITTEAYPVNITGKITMTTYIH